MTEVEFLRRELERQLKAVDDLNKMVKDLSQITFESKMDKWLKASKVKEWIGLTDEDVEEVERWIDFKEAGSDRVPTGKLARYIENKLRVANGFE